jgi:ketosteroid isomerase-like protein
MYTQRQKGISAMKRFIGLLLTMALCAGVTVAQTKGKGDSKMKAERQAEMDELKQIEKDWTDAQKAKDSDKLAEILDDRWIGIGVDGKSTTKAEAVSHLKMPGYSMESIDFGPMRVRIFGNMAVVTGTDTEKSSEAGKDTSGKYVWTDVFVKRDAKWKAVSSQDTKLP